MAHRNIHYEAALEDYLRARGCPYVAVDESKKALFADVALKGFDFLIYSASGPNLLADVKGRKFPDTSTGRQRGASRAWENWVTRDDLESLAEWERVFGSGFVATLVFAYWLQGPPQAAPFDDVHFYRGRHYAFIAWSLEEYVACARPRSSKWQTLSIPVRQFVSGGSDILSLL